MHAWPHGCGGGGHAAKGGVDDAEQEAWLLRMLAMIPHQERPTFYELVIDINPDAGPIWLDRLIGVRAANLAAARAANGHAGKEIVPPIDDTDRLNMVVRRLEDMVG